MAREFFCAYHSILNEIETLSDAEIGRLFMAGLNYSQSGTEPDLRGNERHLFPTWKARIDREKESYRKKCKINSDIAKERERKNRVARTCTNVHEKHKEEEEEEEEEKRDKGQEIGGASHTHKFIPPSVDDVLEYCRKRGNRVDAERFVAHYEASGWFRGKTKIKDWRACVRTWERDGKSNVMPIGKSKSYEELARELFGGDELDRERDWPPYRGIGEGTSEPPE